MTNPLDKLNLRPFEKRLVIGVLVLLFLVVNAVFVWPRFKDWNETQDRLAGQRGLLEKYTKGIGEKKNYEGKVKEFESQGATVAADDQANQFLRTVQNQAAISHVSIMGNSRQATYTNEFSIEQLQTFTVQAEESQLVDFLYALGSGDSIIRARGLSLRPNQPRQQLSGNLDLVASYQKKSPAKAGAPKTATAPKP
jgi:hypothetical protein